MSILFGRFVPDRPVWGWDRIGHPVTHVSHIMPLLDVGAHAFDEDCRCRPIVDEYGVTVHNAFDGREAYEQGRRHAH